jgi:alanine racemase
VSQSTSSASCTPSDPGRTVRSGPARFERAATIDLAAIRHNIERVRDTVAPAAVMAVVKADAYGHGVLPVARAALEAGAGWLGTVHVSEALALRHAGIAAPILAWLHTEDTDFEAAVAAHVDLGVSGWDLDRVALAADAAGSPARVHLKIDTGLGRNGCTPAQWPEFVARAKTLQDAGSIEVVGIFSHLAVADEPGRAETDEQLAAFTTAVAQAEDAGLSIRYRHLANSPALLSRPDTHFDLVRCGLAMYGLSPFEDRTAADLGLRPAMRLSARIANVKHVPAGQGVSYGLRWHAERPTTLGLVPLGYADGIPRIAEHGPVLVNGRLVHAVGRVAMDQFVVDLGPDATEEEYLGAEAVLFGGDGEPSVDAWADAASTINYEVVTRISPRVPRHLTEGTEHD